MSDYGSNINTFLYKYSKPVYITEVTGTDQTFIPLKLSLNSRTFNFDLARDDGLDFRLAESSNGSGVLQMWIPYWDADLEVGEIWFKLPELLAGETRQMWAYWGYASDGGVESLSYMLGESLDGVVYTGNFAYTATTSGSAAVNPDNVIDGTGSYSDIPLAGWIQFNYPTPRSVSKVVVRGDNSGWYGYGFEVRGSNDAFASEDVLVTDITESITYFDATYYFYNGDNYSNYRIVNDKGQAFWRVEEIQMMSVDSGADLVSTPVFIFGDDFNGSEINLNKWPVTGGSWSINQSRIDLNTDAYIQCPAGIIGEEAIGYVGTPWKNAGVDGVWGGHQYYQNCYLNLGILYYGMPNLIDGNVTTTSGCPLSNAGYPMAYISSPGCALGVDMGVIRDKISKVRVYLIQSDTPVLSWLPTAWVTLTIADSNDAAEDWVNHKTYSYDQMPLIKHSAGVWYFDLVVDVPGVSARLVRVVGRLEVDVPLGARYISEIEVWSQNATTSEAAPRWLVEEGVHNVGSPTSTAVAAHRYRFYGGSNPLGIDYFWEGATDRRHDFVYDGTYSTYNGTNRGLLTGTDKYSQNYIAYLELVDHVYQGMHNRGGDAIPIWSEDLCVGGSISTDPVNFSFASALFDDNLASFWWTSSTTQPRWFGYAFPEPVVINRFKLYTTRGFFGLEIQGSNDLVNTDWNYKTWDTIYDPGTIDFAEGDHDFIFDPVNTTAYKYVRLYALDSQVNNEPYVAECEMMSILSYTSDLDYEDSWERRVHGNTATDKFRIYGPDTSAANGVAIDWVIVRDYNPDAEPELDITQLYIEYERIDHQLLDSVSYQPDATDVGFHHESSMGGDPYEMSDNLTAWTNTFTSDDNVVSGTITIDFGRSSGSVTDPEGLYYNDSDTFLYYSADKLSDLDTDVHGRDYWSHTTTSGWAAASFTSAKNISCLTLTAVSTSTDRMAKNFKFYGSNTNPRYQGYDDKVLVASGIAAQRTGGQPFYFSTGATSYWYYILEVLDTYGGPIAIQEWTMHEDDELLGKKVITQLRLRPNTELNNEYYFPKQIEFHASNDGETWVELIPTIDTPTPFVDYAYGRWSRYTFSNNTGYYMYKLTCHDNWGASEDRMKIAEWEMVETVAEGSNIRILFGDSSNINNIWADPDTTIDDGVMYMTSNTAFNAVENEVIVGTDVVVLGGAPYWRDTDVMSDELTTGGVATASLGTYSAGLEPDKAFDNSLGTYWHSVVYSAYPIWIQYNFTEAQQVNYMRMYPRSGYTSRMPGSFILKGSNIGSFSGEETDIVSITGATYTASTWTEFNFTNTGSYLYYRLHITAKASGTGSGNYMNIYEIQMKGWIQELVETRTAVADFNVIL